MCVLKSARRAFPSLVSSRLDLDGPSLLRFCFLTDTRGLGWDNTSSSFPFFRIHVIRLLVGISLVVFGSVSSDRSHLGLYVPYALLYLLFESLVHTQHYLPPPDMLRCPPSSPSSPISDLANTPLLVQNIYISPSFFAITFVLCHYFVSFGFATRFILLLLTL